MVVQLVLTERRSELTETRADNYARLRERLVSASGGTVEAAHYEELDPARLADARAIVLSGSSAPWSTHDPAELERLGDVVRAAGRPVLGICAGLQLQVRFAGGDVRSGSTERGFLPIEIQDGSDLLRGLPTDVVVFHDHTDEVATVPEGFSVLASSPACAVQAIADPVRRWWGTQFHPEESGSSGDRVLQNFFELAR
jgi:GMP synthase (glutamine-hydrolysing)